MYEDTIIPPDFGDPFVPKLSKEELTAQYRKDARMEDRQGNYSIHHNAETVRASEPRPASITEITPKKGDTSVAHDEFEFMKDLFPYQNIKGWNGKSGREFLADFTKATRGQLAVCMSRLAEENPKEFARLWVEMEKFNTPQQSSQQIEANINQRTDLYAQLNAMSQGIDPMSEDIQEKMQSLETTQLIEDQTQDMTDFGYVDNNI